jgi:hypothetical protein
LKYRLEEHFDKHAPLSENEETDLFLYAAAAEMLTWAIPEWWGNRPPPTGLTDDLNRQWMRGLGHARERDTGRDARGRRCTCG